MTQFEALMKKAQDAAARGMQIRDAAAKDARDLNPEELQNMQAAFKDYRDLKAQAETLHESDSVKAELETVIEKPLFGDVEKKDTP